MATIENSRRIDGVRIASLRAYSDDRGRFVETFRQEWFPDASPMIQANRSDSVAGTLRGLHYHFKQADYWYAPRGRVFVALHDLRTGSPTRGSTLTLEMGDSAQLGLYIPPGVAHGFQALTDVTLSYLVDNYYDNTDELGLAWDDPTAAILWPLENPLLSDRDAANPKLDQIAPDRLPS